MTATVLTSASQQLLHPQPASVNSGSHDPPSPMSVNEELVPGEEECAEKAHLHPASYGCKWVTTFLLGHEWHQTDPVPPSQEEAYVWTEKERALARLATTPSTGEELQNEVCLLTCRKWLLSSVIAYVNVPGWNTR